MYLLTGAAAIFSNDHPSNGSHAKYIFEQRQPVAAEKMNKLGICTGAELRRQSVTFLRSGVFHPSLPGSGALRMRSLRPDRAHAAVQTVKSWDCKSHRQDELARYVAHDNPRVVAIKTEVVSGTAPLFDRLQPPGTLL
jgi:hypothetical protein